MSTPKLPKPYVPVTEEAITIAELFATLPYNQQAEVFRQLSIMFDEIMEVQKYVQHQEKIAAIKIEDIEPGLHKLTNVHGNVYYACYDMEGYDKWQCEGHLFWKDGREHQKLYLKGGLEEVCKRICNL